MPSSVRFSSLARLTTGVVLTYACAWVMWHSARAGLSDFNVNTAEHLINSRILLGQSLDVDTLDNARVLLDEAVAWNPRNGGAHQDLALVYRMRMNLPWRDMIERERFLISGLRHAQAAVSLRPTSGYAYSIFAVIKQMRGERDDAFRRALAHAAKYGPWEPGTQINILDVGFRAWDALDESGRDVLRQTITRAMQTQPTEARAFLVARRRALPPCGELRLLIPDVCS